MIVIKCKKLLLFSLACLVSLLCALSTYLTVSALSPRPSTVIVLDAGHGGADGGVTGRNTGVKESDLNLAIAKIIKKKLERQGYAVVLTRKTEDGLYKSLSGSFKSEDFAERKKIIEQANASLVISIHQNFYSSPARRGTQVFYNPDNDGSIAFARSMQTSLNDGVNAPYNGRSFSALKGDYFITKCTDAPAIIIECGFLSNPQDEALLQTEEFCNELAYHIASGVTAYLVSAGAVICD